MNSLRLIFLIVAFCVITTSAIPTANKRISAACQKNLLKKPCNSCKDICSSVDNHTLHKWSSNITNVLFSEEGVEVFERYLHACNFTEAVERLYLWKESSAFMPHGLSHKNQTEPTRKVAELLKHNLFMFKDGKPIPFPKERLHQIHLLQNTIREVLYEDYERFKARLLSDKKAVDKYSAYLCRSKMIKM